MAALNRVSPAFEAYQMFMGGLCTLQIAKRLGRREGEVYAYLNTALDLLHAKGLEARPLVSNQKVFEAGGVTQ
jgi:hypothetical protein